MSKRLVAISVIGASVHAKVADDLGGEPAADYLRGDWTAESREDRRAAA